MLATTKFRIPGEVINAGRTLVGEPAENSFQDTEIGRRMILKWVFNRVKEWLTMEYGGRLL